MKRKPTIPFFLVIAGFLAFTSFHTHGQDGEVSITAETFTNLSASPLVPGATNRAILGIRLDKAGGGTNNINQIVITCDQDPTTRFSAVNLRRSIDPDFGGSEPVAATGVMAGSPGNTITFTASPIYDFGGASGGATAWFFVVVDVRADAVPSLAPITLSLTGSNITMSDNDPVSTGSTSGSAYSILGATISSLNAPANGVAASPLLPGNTSQPIFGFSLSSTGNQTVSAINIQLSSDPSGKLSGFTLVESVDDDASTTGDNSTVSTSSLIVTSSEVQITPTTAIDISTIKHLFLVANVDAATNASTTPIQASLGSTNITVNTGAREGTAAGTNYSFLGATIGSLNAGANNVALSPLVAGATNQAVFGFSLSSNGSQTVSFINVQLTSDPAAKLSNFLLVQSTDTDFATTVDNVVVGTSSINVFANRVEITPTTPIDISTARNLFLVADVDAGVTGATAAIQASLGTSHITVNQGGKSGSATGTDYLFVTPTATIASLNAGGNNVSASPIPAGATGRAIFGFSLSSNGSQTVSAVNIQLSDDPASIFSGFSLVESADADFATTIDNSPVTTSSLTVTTTEIQIVPSAVINISTTRNFFLVANADPTVTVTTDPIQASLGNANFIVNIGSTAGSATGTNYSFTAPTATIGSLNAGANNVAASPLLGGATGQAIFGFSLTSNGSQTVSAINIPLSVPPAGIFSGYTLVVSGDDNFGTTGDNSIVSPTGFSVAGNVVMITPAVPIDISTPKNLFLVANVNPAVTGASGPIQASLSDTNLTLNQGSATGSATGTNYGFTPLQATVGSLNAGLNNVATSPILGGSLGEALFGFSLSSNGNQTVSQINVQLSEDPAGIFSNFSLVQSTDADFATAVDNSTLSVSGLNVTTSAVEITLTTPIDISSIKNLFLVADVSATVTGASGPIQASLSEADFTVNQGNKATSSATGTDYSFASLEATIGSLNAGGNNVATSPILGGSLGEAIFGFSLSSNGNQTVSQIDVQLSSDPAGIFSNFSLVQSTDADFATAVDNSTLSVSGLNVTTSAVEITLTTPIDISSIKNLFLIADVSATVTGASGPIQASLSEADFTVNQGNKATSSATGTDYSFASLEATIGSLNAGGNNVATSPILGSSLGEAIFGFSLSSNGNQTVSQIDVQLSSDPAGIFSNFSLVQSTDADFATAVDNSTLSVSGLNVTTSAVEITLTTPIDISSIKNLFLVADVSATVTGASGPIQASLSQANFTVNQGNKAVSSAAGTNYGFTQLTASIGSLNAPANNVAASPLLGGNTGQAVFGFSVSSNGSQTISAINIQLTSDPANKLTSFTLVESTDANFATSGDNTTVSVSSITPTINAVQIVPATPIDISSVKNLFLVANVHPDVTAATPTIRASLAAANFDVNQGFKSGTVNDGVIYSFQELTATITSLNNPINNVAVSPLVGGSTGQAIFGFSLSSNGNQTVSNIMVNVSSTPVGKFSNYSLVQSVDADFTTTGDNSVVPTSSITPNASFIQITPTAAIDISPAKNLFLVADVAPNLLGTTPAVRVTLTAANLDVDQGSTSGSALGTNYSFEELTATIGSLNGVANNVAASPLIAGSTGQAVFGFSLSSNGNQTVSEIRIQLTSNPAGKLGNFSLVQSTDTDFGTPGNNSTVSTSSIVVTSTQVQITPTTPIDISSIKNLFLVADVNTGVTSAAASFQASINDTNFTENQGFKSGSATGVNYLFNSSQTTAITVAYQGQTGITLSEYSDDEANPVNVTQGNSQEIFGITITDADADNHSTTINQLIFNLTNEDNLATISLFDGATKIASQVVSGSTATFSGLSYVIADGSGGSPSSETLTIRVTFASSVDDNEMISVTLTSAQASVAGSGIASFAGIETLAGRNPIDVDDTEMRFITPPASVSPNVNFSIVIQATDNRGNVDVDENGNVTLSKDSGSGTFTAGDAGGLTRAFVNGEVTWTQVQFSLADDYVIRADHATFADITHNIECISLGVLITGPSNQNFCYGGNFEPLNTITITERDPSDFGVGTNVSFSFVLPDGFVFNTALTTITPSETGDNVSGITAITYIGNNIARFTYSVSAINSMDAIIISGLQVKYTGTSAPTSTDIIRIGGSALQQGNNIDDPALSHGTITASAASNAGYNFITDEFSGQPTINDNETRFSISVEGVKLLPSGSNPVIAGTVFSGNGVSYSASQSSYVFSPSSVGVSTNAVTMTVNNGSCNITVTKNFEVFASTITNLNSDYCSNATPATGLSVPSTTLDFVINNYLIPYYGGIASEWVFHDFVYYDWNTGFQPIPAPNTTFDPQAPQYQLSILNFGGVYVYYRVRNTNPASPYNANPIVWDGQFVIIQQAPNVSLNLPNTTFCYDGTSIDLDAAATPPPANASDLFTHSHTGPAGISSVGNQWTFTPGNVENADVATQTFNVTYSYTNPSTNCSNTITRTITVHPTPAPVPPASITSGTTIEVCRDGLSGDFTANSVLGTTYNWYDQTVTPPALRTGNSFNPNGYFDASTPGNTSFFVTRTINGCESTGPHLELTVTVNPLPTVDAGPATTSVCAGDEVLLTTLGATFGGTASSAAWTVSSSSPGVFLDASDAVVPMPAPFGTAVKYIPSASEINLGNVTLILTTNDPSGPCTPVADNVQVIINSVAQANAGTNQDLCSGSAVQLNGTIGGAATSQTWYKNAVAPFNIIGTSLSITYSPTVTELQNGAVIDFILVTDDPPGLCPAASSTVTITIHQKPTVSAGPDLVVCSGDPIMLNGSFGATASSVTWSGGGGSFANNLSEDTEYLPSAAELQNGAAVNLTLLTDDPSGPCAAESDVMRLTINPIPNAPLANSPAPYCVNQPIANLTATGNNLKWYDDAFLTNQVSAGSTFASGVQSDTEKTAPFYVTQTVLGCESPATTVTITVNPLPVPDFSAVNYCLGDAMVFTDASSVNNGTIVKWGWRFDDGDELQRESGIIPAGTHNGRTTGMFDSPSHTYASIGIYNVRLTVESDKGCLNTLTKNYPVGSVPQADFTARELCENDLTQFTYQNNNPAPAAITTWAWDFGDPMSGTSNTSSNPNPTHEFAGDGTSASSTYPVTLTLITALGCESTITKNISILPYVSSFPYVEGFEDNSHGWIAEGLNFNQYSSWQLAVPDGQVISTAADGTRAWYTHVDSLNTYFNNERSVLYGPCLDMTQIDRPVLSLQYWDNTDLGNDGAYMEVSADGGQTWQVLGGINQGGLNWYNRAAILGLAQQNGIGQPIGQVGWTGDTRETGETNGWTYAKFNLDPFRNETKLRVRIVFGSNGDNPTDRPVDGIAFDDFRIEQRNRTILAENFTNASAEGFDTNNNGFRNFQNTVTTNELVKIQYHTSIGGNDPIHLQNTADPNARAAFYGITAPLQGYVDGSSSGNFITLPWANNEYNSRTLVASPLEISINVTADPSGLFTVEPSILAISDLPLNRQYVIHTAIVEKQVGNETFILRKLLPTAAGTPLTTLTQNDLQTLTLSTTLTNVEDPNDLAVIVFVQELQGTKEVLQAALLDNVPAPSIVTEAEEKLSETIGIYPIPADDEVNVALQEPAKRQTPILLYDTFGHTVHGTVLEIGEGIKTISTKHFASGVYMIQVGNDKNILRREKVMIIHK